MAVPVFACSAVALSSGWYPGGRSETVRIAKNAAILIAVLPFLRDGDEASSGPLAKALTHDLTGYLAHYPQLRVVADNARMGLVIVDRDRRYLYANAAYETYSTICSSSCRCSRTCMPTLSLRRSRTRRPRR